MLGIELMENFDHPYRAKNIKEFWRSWHISLTKWFTDYLYIPLGGSRKGFLRTCCNTMTVFAISGLWHGLSLHYLVWGLLHGIFFNVFHMTDRFRSSHSRSSNHNSRCCRLSCQLMARLTTFAAVCFAWIFFRAESLLDASILLGRIFFHFCDIHPAHLLSFFHMRTMDLYRLFLVFFCLHMLERLPDHADRVMQPKGTATAAFFSFCIVTVSVLSWLVGLAENGGNAFIYFSF